MIRIICIFLLIFPPVMSFAQAEWVAFGQKFQIEAASLPKFEVIDSTVLVAQFQYTYPVDNFKNGFVFVSDILDVQISERFSKTFSHNLHLMDQNKTYREKRHDVKLRFDYADFEVFNNYPEGKNTVQRRIPFAQKLQGSTQMAEYTENLPDFRWHITERTDSVAEHLCRIAEGNIGGRVWTVWFSEEIPLYTGVWKFNGLPGMVLKAVDKKGDYTFECIKITSCREAILKYNWKPVKMTKSKWLQLEKDMYDNPDNYFTKNGKILITDMETFKPLKEKWVVRYNPIEFE